jgi:hypothetical protein
MATDNRKETNSSALESQAVALAEQLGRIAGTIEGTAEQWLNRPAIAEQLTRVRDSASLLLESLTSSAAKGRQAVTGSAGAMSGQVRDAATKAVNAASSAVASLGASVGRRTTKRSSRKTAAARKSAKSAGDLAHAPGKKHRKPAPSKRGVKHSEESIPKMKTATVVRQRRKSWA